VSENISGTPFLRIGLLTLDPVNEMYASKFAAKTRDLVIAAPKLESLQAAEVHAIVYDHDHLKMLGNPVELVIPGAARVQVAFGHTLTGADARRLHRRGVIVCRRLQTAIRLVARLLRYRPATAM
jgi:hypothetical protein